MKIKTKLTITLTLLLLAIGSPVASASDFTPDRPDNFFNLGNDSNGNGDYDPGEYGYNYATFNNYQYPDGQYNLAGPQRNNDEREFTLVKYCPNDVCPDAFSDTLNLQNASAGDSLVFEILFHNNGSDPYDEHNDSNSTPAEDVKIGIDLNNSANPLGFIYSPDNAYVDGANNANSNLNYNPNNLIEYENGDYIFENAQVGDTARTISDETQLLNLPNNLGFDIVNNEAFLIMEYEGDTFYTDLINNNSTAINVSNAQPAQTLNAFVTTDENSKQSYIEFDRMPGCFRYMGAVRFKVYLVEKPNVCEDLNIVSLQEVPEPQANTITSGQHNGPLYEIQTDNIDFSGGTIPPATLMHWEALDDPNARFWAPSLFGGGYYQTSSPSANMLAYNNAHIYFEGHGRVRVKLTNIPDEQNSNACSDIVVVQEVEQACEDLLVDHLDPIYENRLSAFTAQAIGDDNKTFNGKITYRVDEGYGYFYTVKPPFQENNEADVQEITEITGAAPAINEPEGGWCGPNASIFDLENLAINPGIWSYTPPGSENQAAQANNNTPGGESSGNQVPGSIIGNYQAKELINFGIDYSLQGLGKPQIEKVPDYIDTGIEPKPQARNFDLKSYSDGRRMALSVIDLELEADINIPFYGETSITVDPGTEVYFWATQPGEGVVHVQTNCTEEDACTRHFDIKALPRVCEDLKVNRPDPVLENRVSTFSAMAEDNEGDTFNGKITYSVDPGYGRIYLNNPIPLLPGNPNNDTPVIEFDPDTNFTAPEAGWCGEAINVNLPESNATKFPGILGGKAKVDLIPNLEVEKKAFDFSDFGGVVLNDNKGDDKATKKDEPAVKGKIDFDYKNTTRATNKKNTQKVSGLALPDVNPKTAINIAAGMATDAEKTVEKYEKDIIQIPDWLIAGVQPTTGGPDPTPLAKPLDQEINLEQFELGKALQNFSFMGTGAIEVNPVPTPDDQYINPNLEGIDITPEELDLLPGYQTLIMALSVDELDPGVYPHYQSVTVDPGTEVYIWAEKPGVEVIHVNTNCTEEDDCTRHFDIEAVPRSCESLELSCNPANPQAGEDITCEAINTVDSEGDPLPETTEITWETDTGCLFPNGLTNYVSTLADGPVTCTGGENGGEITVSISVDDPLFDPVCADEIEIEGLACEDLSLQVREFGDDIADLVNELSPTGIYQVRAEVDYNPNTYNGDVRFTIDPNVGVFIDNPTAEEFADLITQLLLQPDTFDINDVWAAVEPIKTSYARVAPESTDVILVTFGNAVVNANALEAVALDPESSEFANPACAQAIPLNIEAPVCESLNLFKNANDCVSISGNFSNHDGEIVVATSEGQLSKDNNSFSNSLTFSAAEVAASGNLIELYCQGTENATITAEAVGAEQECSDILTFSEVQECIDLEITNPDSPWNLDDNDDDQTVQISVSTSPNSYANELNYRYTTTEGQWEESNDDSYTTTDATVQKFVAHLEDIADEEPEIAVVAIDADGNEIPACEDAINSNREEGDEPKIQKFVYPVSSIQDADPNLINIAEYDVTPWVTYMLVTSVEDIDSKHSTIDIWDSKIDKNSPRGPYGEIKSSSPLVDGELIFKEMAIFVIDGNDKEIIYMTPNYQADTGDGNAYNEFHDLEYSFGRYDVRDIRSNHDVLIKELHEEYSCDSDEVNSNDFCLDEWEDWEDWENIVDEFGNGEKITFNNVDQLGGSDPKIIIKYEMTNNSDINANTCKELTSQTGCGEIFRNIGELETSDYEDSDDAEVVVVCPFILTREGGDVFFHDDIDIGAEAAYCSEFKGGDGPGIKPTPAPKAGIVSTGSTGEGDLEEGLLSLDTHDICKLSNLDTGIEGYNNALKHFSSSICEFQAEVAADLKENTINKAVKANLFRIARWGATVTQNLNLPYPGQIDNNNGVVVLEEGRNLTIDNFTSDYIINSNQNNGLPMAQTYIIQGGNLNIKSNIVYPENVDLTDPNNVPSVAFIVIDGNINIDHHVSRIDGIYMALDTDQSGDGKVNSVPSQINSDAKSKTQLTVNGNLVGDVFKLFNNRINTGNSAKDEAAVTIHFQSNLLLNQPPGINDLVNIEYALVPN